MNEGNGITGVMYTRDSALHSSRETHPFILKSCQIDNSNVQCVNWFSVLRQEIIATLACLCASVSFYRSLHAEVTSQISYLVPSIVNDTFVI